MLVIGPEGMVLSIKFDGRDSLRNIINRFIKDIWETQRGWWTSTAAKPNLLRMLNVVENRGGCKTLFPYFSL